MLNYQRVLQKAWRILHRFHCPTLLWSPDLASNATRFFFKPSILTTLLFHADPPRLEMFWTYIILGLKQKVKAIVFNCIVLGPKNIKHINLRILWVFDPKMWNESCHFAGRAAASSSGMSKWAAWSQSRWDCIHPPALQGWGSGSPVRLVFEGCVLSTRPYRPSEYVW
jgi:hypothetical protein